MIVSCVLDPDVFSGVNVDPAEFRASHRRFVRLWRRLGVLLHGEDEDLGQLVSRINDQEARKLWYEALRRNRQRAVASDVMSALAEATAVTQLAQAVNGADLACVEGAKAELVGLPQSEPSIVLADGSPEICRFSCVDDARAFRRASELAQKHVDVGVCVEQLWKDRFDALARCSRHVVVMDPYCLQDHVGWLCKKVSGPSGLTRFLNKLDETGVPHDVVIYCMVDDKRCRDESVASAVVEDQWQRLVHGGVRTLQLKLGLEPHRFKKVAHDRYVRFDNVLVNLGCGLGLLAGETVARYCAFGLEEASGPTEVELALEGRVFERRFERLREG